MSNENRGGGGGFFAGFVIGGLIGGAVAALLIQEEMRDMLVGKAREAGNLAMDATGDLRGKMTDYTASWQDSAADLYERGRRVVENARGTIDSAMSEGTSAADDARSELQRKAEG